MKFRGLFIGFVAVVALLACKKNKQYDYAGHLATDDAIIIKYLADNNLTSRYTKDESGIYYQMIKPGTEDVTFSVTSLISTNYRFRLLGDNKTIDSTGVYQEDAMLFENAEPASFYFNESIIPGFRIGTTYLKKGGVVKVIIPSPLGYQDDPRRANVPPNSILDYTIELTDVQ